MEILKPSDLTKDILNMDQMGSLLVICTDVPRVRKRIDDAGYQEVQVNQELSKHLLCFPNDERAQRVEETLKSVLNYRNPLFITRFEMLFDPRYKLDVLKFFCEKARIVNVAIKWPGLFIGDKLTYASREEADYHEYDCNAYQIRIVH